MIECVVEETYEIQTFQPFQGWVFERFCDRSGNTYFALTAAAIAFLQQQHPQHALSSSFVSSCSIATSDHVTNASETDVLNPLFASPDSVEQFEIGRLPTSEWMWSHPWMPDTDTQCDDDGWSYGSTIARINRRFAEGTSKIKREYYHFVRRRRWIRTRIKKPVDDNRLDPPLTPMAVHAVPHKRYYRMYRDSLLAHLQFTSRPRLSNFIKIEFTDDVIEKEGWLGQRGSFSRAWKLRYFLLRADTSSLICLRDRASLVQVSETPIDRHTSVLIEDSLNPEQFQFLVINDHHKLRLNAVDERCRQSWVSALSELIVASRASFLAATEEGSDPPSTNRSSRRSRTNHFNYRRMRSSIGTDDGVDGPPTAGAWTQADVVVPQPEPQPTEKDPPQRKRRKRSWRPYKLICSTVFPRDDANRAFNEQFMADFATAFRVLIETARAFVMQNIDILEENLQHAEDFLSSAIASVPIDELASLRTDTNASFDGFHAQLQHMVVHAPQRTTHVLRCNKLRKELFVETKQLHERVQLFTPPAIRPQLTVKKSFHESPKRRIPTDWFTEPSATDQKPTNKVNGATSESQHCTITSTSSIMTTHAPQSQSQHHAAAHHHPEAYVVKPYEPMPSVLSDGHLELPSGVNDFVVMVHEKDLGSLIAFTLCSSPYIAALESHFGDTVAIRRELAMEETYARIDCDVEEAKRFRYLHKLRSNDVQHTDVRFNYETAASVKHEVRCVAFFAAQFHALRRLVGVGNVNFLGSIAKSKKWDARCGKSGAFFSMTHDKRFVLKGIPLTEFNMFLHMAPQYFKFLSRVIESQSPTVITKILGLFKVTQSRKLSKHTTYVVVMENLTYGFTPGQMYDLKGILRRRYHVPSNATTTSTVDDEQSQHQHILAALSSLSSTSNLSTPSSSSAAPTSSSSSGPPVLMDGNFVELIPVPIRQSDLTVVNQAIQHDTNFLCRAGVIDYSLLLFFDATQRRVVVGLIDYLHQFDFLKKMESTSKASLTFRNPTIISPTSYQRRFVNAMHRYLVGIELELELRIRKRTQKNFKQEHHRRSDERRRSQTIMTTEETKAEQEEPEEQADPRPSMRQRGKSLPDLAVLSGNDRAYDRSALVHSDGDDYGSDSSDEVCLKSSHGVIASFMPELEDDDDEEVEQMVNEDHVIDRSHRIKA